MRHTSNVEPLTNVLPQQMSLSELLAGYIELVERIRDWRNFEQRVQTLLAQVRRQPQVRFRVQPTQLLLLVVMLAKMNRQGRRTALRLLLYTLRRAPFMVERVMAAVAYQYQEALRVPHLKRFIAGQIRQLETGELSLQRERQVFAVPDEFRKFYPALFPDLYARVHQGLQDKSRAEDALVEVTYDFLARWGPSFRQFEEHHRTFLYELCDRTVAAENNTLQASSDRRPASGQQEQHCSTNPDVRLRRLAADVLHCVEQDLRSLGG
jgi:hypothetical protein